MTTARLSPASRLAAASMTSRDAAGVGETAFAVSVAPVAARVCWLAAAGKLVGASAAAQLADVLEQQCAAGRRFVRLDLSEVPMLDRLGFDVLVAAHHRFLAGGGTLLLTGVSPRIRRLLELTGLDQTLFTIGRATDPPPALAGQQSDRGLAAAGSDDSATHDEQLSVRASTVAAARAVIDQAVGVVMGRARCGVAEATERHGLLPRLVQLAGSVTADMVHPGRAVDLARDVLAHGKALAELATLRPERHNALRSETGMPSASCGPTQSPSAVGRRSPAVPASPSTT